MTKMHDNARHGDQINVQVNLYIVYIDLFTCVRLSLNVKCSQQSRSDNEDKALNS